MSSPTSLDLPGPRPGRLPRDLHPVAWWTWALGLAAAAARTTNPWLLLLIVAVVSATVVARRTDAPWAMSFRLYLLLGAVVVLVRVVFRVLLGGGFGETVLLDLPAIPLPSWAAGITLLGPLTQEALLGAVYDGLRLATIIICVGGANSLADPRKLLASLPPALYEMGTAVVIAFSLFPQLAESVQRVRRARRLRGDTGSGIGSLRRIVVPVLEDALERSSRSRPAWTRAATVAAAPPRRAAAAPPEPAWCWGSSACASAPTATWTPPPPGPWRGRCSPRGLRWRPPASWPRGAGSSAAATVRPGGRRRRSSRQRAGSAPPP